MAAIASKVGNLFNPAFYTKAWASTATKAHAYYHPQLRENGSTFLWHMMLGVSAVMYSGTFYARVYQEVQVRREQKRVAMAEYYEKHGGGDHH